MSPLWAAVHPVVIGQLPRNAEGLQLRWFPSMG